MDAFVHPTHQARLNALALALGVVVEEFGAWPDDWSRCQRAVDDTSPRFIGPRLEKL